MSVRFSSVQLRRSERAFTQRHCKNANIFVLPVVVRPYINLKKYWYSFLFAFKVVLLKQTVAVQYCFNFSSRG